MKVLILCPGSDLAGVGIGIKRAFDQYSDWEVRQIRRVPWHYGYPHDAEWKDRKSYIEWADVVHVMEQPEFIPSKPAVLHHHGDYLRRNRDRVLAEQRSRGALGIASTLDLYLLAPDELEWLPTPVDVDALASMRVPNRGPLRVAHAPTDRVSKSTGPLLAACERLGLQVDLIERQSWSECLSRKAGADIYFDQVLTGYGVNAIEAMAMGIPVIAGVEAAEATRRGWLIHPDTLGLMVRRFGGLPFVRANERTIDDALRLLTDPAQRLSWAAKGTAHVRRFHDYPVVVRQLEDIYRRALSQGTGAGRPS